MLLTHTTICQSFFFWNNIFLYTFSCSDNAWICNSDRNKMSGSLLIWNPRYCQNICVDFTNIYINFVLIFVVCTGKSFLEALIFASTNPRYDDKLFIELQVHCSIHENSKLKPGENMLCAEIVSDIQNNFWTQHVLPMFCKKKSFWQRFTCTTVSYKRLKNFRFGNLFDHYLFC